MFDFGLFLTGTVVFFSIIGIACVGVGAYVVLLNDSQKRGIKREIEIEKNGIGNRRLVG